MAEMKECFDFYDRDGDGKVKKEEVPDILRSVGHMLTKKELTSVLSEVAGALATYDEVAEIAKRRPWNAEQQTGALMKAFKVFDPSNSGLIDGRELQQLVTTLGDKLTAKEYEDIAKVANLPASGKIEYAKVVDLMVSGGSAEK
eukprot:NODE_21980_length_727_cov_7.838333.p1 GENE.NODE_21980_length_727_cov_7.838333~~NODE_21980_length_727_cov_7.838333.p1  ORF type:complete len:144 (+),score=67.48 NODE_21980_length_727_cov_7.838333:80-511(+)